MLNIAVACSQNWDSKEAALEIASSLKSKSNESPAFILLFATHHYQRNSGYDILLDTFCSCFPKDTQIIGGSIAGFISHEFCSTRGIAALCVFGDGLTVAVGVGRNTKLNPTGAGKECANQILKKLSDSNLKNRYFISFVSSAVVPSFPFFSNRKVVPKFPGISILIYLFDSLASLFQFGPGKEETIMNVFCETLGSRFVGIGGSNCDNLNLEMNFQFVGKKILTNSLVSIAFATNDDLQTNSVLGLKPASRNTFTITSASSSGYVVKEIDDKPATVGYLESMGWDSAFLNERLYRTVFYFPIVEAETKVKEPRMLGLVYDTQFIFPMKAKVNIPLQIYSSSGQDLFDAMGKLVSNKRPAFIISCGTRMESLGPLIFSVKEKILDKNIVGDYLLIYCAGEFIKESDGKVRSLYQSDNSLSF